MFSMKKVILMICMVAMLVGCAALEPEPRVSETAVKPITVGGGDPNIDERGQEQMKKEQEEAANSRGVGAAIAEGLIH